MPGGLKIQNTIKASLKNEAFFILSFRPKGEIYLNLIAIGDSTISFPRLVVETHGVRLSLRAQRGNLFSNFKSALSIYFFCFTFEADCLLSLLASTRIIELSFSSFSSCIMESTFAFSSSLK